MKHKKTISVRESPTLSARGGSKLLLVRPLNSSATQSVKAIGSLSISVRNPLLAGNGWVEFAGKQSFLRHYIDGRLQKICLGNVTPTSIAFKSGAQKADQGIYYIGTTTGLYSVTGKSSPTFLPVGNTGYPHITSLKLNKGSLKWTDMDDNKGQLFTGEDGLIKTS